MKPLPNPFLNSAESQAFPADEAATPITPLSGVAANPSSTGGFQESPVAVQPKPTATGLLDNLGCDITDVGEIFHFARMLCADAKIHPGTISAEVIGVCEEIRAYEDVYCDPPPLFLRRAM